MKNAKKKKKSKKLWRMSEKLFVSVFRLKPVRKVKFLLKS